MPGEPSVSAAAPFADPAPPPPWPGEEEPAGQCVFHEPWWLEAVAPGRWREAGVRDDRGVAARLPYVLAPPGRFTAHFAQPALAPYLGPWVRDHPSKPAARLVHEREMLDALLDQLPDVTSQIIVCRPEWTLIAPFRWRGYAVYAHTYYRFPADRLSDPDRLLDGMLPNTRRNLRKAERETTVSVDAENAAADLWTMLALTYGRQGLPPPCSREAFDRLDAAAAARGRRAVFLAKDGEGRTHAGLYAVWDDGAVYYLLGGGHPERRQSGAQSLVLWRAIGHAAAMGGRAFDFQGTTVEGIDRFMRGFGAAPAPVFTAVKVKPWLAAYRAARDFLRSR